MLRAIGTAESSFFTMPVNVLVYTSALLLCSGFLDSFRFCWLVLAFFVHLSLVGLFGLPGLILLLLTCSGFLGLFQPCWLAPASLICTSLVGLFWLSWFALALLHGSGIQGLCLPHHPVSALLFLPYTGIPLFAEFFLGKIIVLMLNFHRMSYCSSLRALDLPTFYLR